MDTANSNTRNSSEKLREHSTCTFSTFPYQCLLEHHGQAWLKLNVTNSRSTNPKSLPLFFGGDDIVGSVEIDVDKHERHINSIKAVAISVKAGTTSIGQDAVLFLDLSREIWNASGNSTHLKGQHSLPFSIVLPAEVSVPETQKGAPATYHLPPTVSERQSPGAIDYKLFVIVERGRLSVDSKLATEFAYIPLTHADPLAYSEGNPPPGPDADPDGGRCCHQLLSKESYLLAIAKPLKYAMGTPLPLVLTMSCSDKQALDILSAAASIRVLDRKSQQSRGRAYCWPLDEPGEGTKRMQGEINIPKNLKPTFSLPRFDLEYAVTLLLFQGAGFVPSIHQDEPLLIEEVTIVTTDAHGIGPRSYAPSEYDMPEEGDYPAGVAFVNVGTPLYGNMGRTLD